MTAGPFGFLESAVFCTVAPYARYLRRVERWRWTMRAAFGDCADLWCFCDGPLDPDGDGVVDGVAVPEWLSASPGPGGVRLFECGDAALGRPSVREFPGYKRSFGAAMRELSGYRRVMLLETDVLVLSWRRLLEAYSLPGLYGALDGRYGWLETAAMVLNSQEARSRLARRYSTEESWRCTALFEHEVPEECPEFDLCLKSIRLEGRPACLLDGAYDLACQAGDQYTC